MIDCGKPSTFFAAAVDELLELAEPVLVVGDSLEDDIALAKGNGWFGMLAASVISSGRNRRAGAGLLGAGLGVSAESMNSTRAEPEQRSL